MHCGEECTKVKPTTISYSTEYYHRRKKYYGGRPHGTVETGEWVCPGHGLTQNGAIGISFGVVFGVTAIIFIITAVQWKKGHNKA